MLTISSELWRIKPLEIVTVRAVEKGRARATYSSKLLLLLL
jgi:hypothetical protein